MADPGVVAKSESLAKPRSTVTKSKALQPAASQSAPLTAADRQKLVRAQLAASEFGPALQTAKSATDARERTALLRIIACAQRKCGNWQAADLAISHVPIPESRDASRAELRDTARD
jgi:hypothetical protein